MTTPKPAPKPAPKPMPGPPRVSPATVVHTSTRPVALPVAAVSDEQVEAARVFGVVDADTVFVTDGDERHKVGPAKGDDPIAVYAKAYYEVHTSVERLHARIVGAGLSVKDIEDSLRTVRDSVMHPTVVGDLAALRERFTQVEAEAASQLEVLREQRRAARAEATAHRESIVAQAEEIAALDPDKIHWRDSMTKLTELMDEWKVSQKDEARLSKDTEKALWKRLSHARTTFDKARKAHFSQLDKINTDVAHAKETLVASAERLAETTDWDRGARGFKELMDQWRTSGRGRRSVDDALWNRFKAAQDAFFEAKRVASDQEDAAMAENVPAKEAAVVAAEAILPIKDLNAAKGALRAAQDRFDAAGMVPRADLGRLTARIGAVEKTIRDAQDKAWTSRNPELEARASGMAAQLVAAIEALEAQIVAATAAGDSAKVKKLSDDLAARKAWLGQVSS